MKLDLRPNVPLVFVATVERVHLPVQVTPVDLPAGYVDATGADSGEDLAWTVTSVDVTVTDSVLGEVDAGTTTMTELGCFSPKACSHRPRSGRGC